MSIKTNSLNQAVQYFKIMSKNKAFESNIIFKKIMRNQNLKTMKKEKKSIPKT